MIRFVEKNDTIKEVWSDIWKKKPSIIQFKSKTILYDVNKGKVLVSGNKLYVEYPKAYPSDVLLQDSVTKERYQVRAGEVFSILDQGGGRLIESLNKAPDSLINTMEKLRTQYGFSMLAQVFAIIISNEEIEYTNRGKVFCRSNKKLLDMLENLSDEVYKVAYYYEPTYK